jgi:hypothetical protein
VDTEREIHPPEVHPYLPLVQRFILQHGPSLREVPRGPTPLGRTCPTPTLGVGRVGCARPLIVGVGRGGRAPDPLPLGSGNAVVSFSGASRWAIDAPSPGGLFCGHLTTQLAQAAYLEGANP